MTDPTALTAIVTSLKTATDIAKLLKETGSRLEQAELRNRLADLLNSLADAKLELAEVRDTLLARDARISELEEAFQVKQQLVKYEDGMYQADGGGKPHGDAFCLRCWEEDKKTRKLVFTSVNYSQRICPTCKTLYAAKMTNPQPG